MRLARDDVDGLRPDVADHGQCVNGPLDAFTGTEQSPGEEAWPLLGILKSHGVRHGRAVRDDRDLSRVDDETGAQTNPSGLGHHHDGVGGANDRFEHRTLVRRRVFQDGVGDDDRRSVDSFEDRDDRLTVRSVVDPVLVLHDDDVGSIQLVHGVDRLVTVVIGQLGHVHFRRWLAVGADPYDGDVVAVLVETARQRRGERRDAALRRRIRRDHRVRTRHVVIHRCLVFKHWLLLCVNDRQRRDVLPHRIVGIVSLVSSHSRVLALPPTHRSPHSTSSPVTLGTLVTLR